MKTKGYVWTDILSDTPKREYKEINFNVSPTYCNETIVEIDDGEKAFSINGNVLVKEIIKAMSYDDLRKYFINKFAQSDRKEERFEKRKFN